MSNRTRGEKLRRGVIVVCVGLLGLLLAGVSPPVGAATGRGHCKPASKPAKKKKANKKKARKTKKPTRRAKKKSANRKRNRARQIKGLSGKVNLNTATSLELQLLPGVGPRRARRIIGWRSRRTFKHIWDLRRVRGFGRKTLRRLSAYLATKGKTTLRKEVPPQAR